MEWRSENNIVGLAHSRYLFVEQIKLRFQACNTDAFTHRALSSLHTSLAPTGSRPCDSQIEWYSSLLCPDGRCDATRDSKLTLPGWPHPGADC